MIQYKSQNPYYQAGKRWHTMSRPPNEFDFEDLRFDDYKYILGDKIFTEESDEARKAFKAVQMWSQLGNLTA